MRKGGGGGTLIFSNIRRPGPFLGLTFWYFVMTPKDIHKIFIPQKIQNFEPQNGAGLRMNENIIVPPPPPSTLSSQIETGAGGVQTQITEKKTLIRVFIVVVFSTILYLFTVQKGRNIYRGGGCNFLLLFFFWGGGGGGGTNPYFYSCRLFSLINFSVFIGQCGP